jgi:tetratricopeptide (TPR) repeat protein
MSLEVELIRWLLLTALAIALVLLVATALAAADPMSTPNLLPGDMGSIAKPMPETVRPFFPENPPVRELPPAEAAARLGTILENHHAGQIGEALAGWSQVHLPEETAHWREIAIGAAYLRVGDLDRAAIHLGAARQLAPQQPVVAFYMGLLQLERAENAGRAPDAPPGRKDIFAAYTPTPAQDKALYQMLAMFELQEAIAEAGNIRLDEPLLVTDQQFEEAAVPQVRHLLAALGADNFLGKAHHTLFGLSLSRNELASAEFHLDRAVATGMSALDGYLELAESYLDQGYTAAAIRVAGKDLDSNYPGLRPLCQRLTEMARGAAPAVGIW